MEITYRLFRPESASDVDQWLELYRLCFHQSVSRDFLHRLHTSNPFHLSTKPLIFVAEQEGRIVGSLSLIPSPLIITGKPGHQLSSCIVCKAMVDPVCRGRGIFSRLLENAHRRAKDEQYDILITFSNSPYSYQAFLKMGYSYITDIVRSKFYLGERGPFQNAAGRLPRYIGDTVFLPLSWAYRRLTPSQINSFRTRYCDAEVCQDLIGKMLKTRSTDNSIYGIRNPPFFRWRFSYTGFHFSCLSLWDGGEMIAYLIVQYRKGGVSAIITDFFVEGDKPDLVRALISELIVQLRKDSFESFTTYSLKRDSGESNFFSVWHGFLDRTPAGGDEIAPRFLWLPLKDDLDTSLLSDKNRWAIQASDTCLFWAD